MYSFDNAGAKETHTVQYFEMFGNRAIYSDGWYARTIHRPAWQPKPTQTLQEDPWELYNSNDDFSLSNNVAASNAAKLKELQALFMTEAEKYHVLPIDDRLLERTNAELVGRPTVMEGRNSITYGPGMKGMGVDIFIATLGKSYTMTADVDVQAGANGVIVAQGGRFGGFSFFSRAANRPSPTTISGWRNLPWRRRRPSVRASTPSSMNSNPMAGWVKAAVGTITIDGNKAGEGRIGRTQPGIFSVDDLADVGTDDGTPVTDYGKSRKFTGTLNKVTIETSK